MDSASLMEPSPKKRKATPQDSANRIPSNTSIVSSTLGKVRSASLPQEYELARFVQDVELNSEFQKTWSTHVPACQWAHVSCEPNTHQVEMLLWEALSLSGTLHWKYMPTSLSVVDLSINEFNGKVAFSLLAPELTEIYFTQNHFEGGLKLKSLPASTKHFCASYNAFSGGISLSNLPQELRTLSLERNQLTGEVDFCHLPRYLKSLDLSGNLFEGTLDINHLSSSLKILFLGLNNFSGRVDVNCLRVEKLTVDSAIGLDGLEQSRYRLENFILATTGAPMSTLHRLHSN